MSTLEKYIDQIHSVLRASLGISEMLLKVRNGAISPTPPKRKPTGRRAAIFEQKKRKANERLHEDTRPEQEHPAAS